MSRNLLSLATLGALILGLTACGNSSATRPASAAVRSATVKLMRSYAVRLPKGEKVRVRSVRVSTSDPHFAAASVFLVGGPYGSKGDGAFVVTMQMGGRWSIILGPGTGFPEECHRSTVKAVAALVRPWCG